MSETEGTAAGEASTSTEAEGGRTADPELTARAGPEPSGSTGPGLAREARAPRIHLSPAAARTVREMIEDAGLGPEGGLRLSARTGAGCSAPLQYHMALEEAPEAEDTVLTAGSLRLFLDPESAWILDGLFVDYLSDSPLGEGFAFRRLDGAGGPGC